MYQKLNKEHLWDIFLIYIKLLVKNRICIAENINLTVIVSEYPMQTLINHSKNDKNFDPENYFMIFYAKTKVPDKHFFKWGSGDATGLLLLQVKRSVQSEYRGIWFFSFGAACMYYRIRCRLRFHKMMLKLLLNIAN